MGVEVRKGNDSLATSQCSLFKPIGEYLMVQRAGTGTCIAPSPLPKRKDQKQRQIHKRQERVSV